MNVSAFKYGLFCRKKYELTSSGCLEPSGEIEWLYKVRRFISDWFKTTPEKAKESIENALSELSPEWFSGQAEAEAAVEKYRILLTRMTDYFFNNGFKIAGGQEAYKVTVGDVEVDDKIDFSYIGKDGKEHMVRIDMLHNNPYSNRAVKDVNKTPFALELLFPAYGLGRTDVFYEVWFLKGKFDSGVKYLLFEEKANANIISFCYEGYDKDAAFRFALEQNRRELTDKDCNDCKCKGMCKGYAEMPVAYIPSGEAVEKAGCQLTEAQQKVVDWKNGTLAVIAVPGAGKTRVIVERVDRLIQSGVKPQNILNLSHTRKAVGELNERIAESLDIDDLNDPDMPVTKTLNGFGYDILKNNEKLLGGSLKLASDGVRKSLLKRVLNDPSVQKISGVNYASMNGKYGLLSRVDSWIMSLKDLGEEEFAKRNSGVDLPSLKFVAAGLDMLFEQYGYIRYDDQIKMVVQLFREHPELVKKYSRIHRYIMVDEYQDCSAEQDEMIRLLAVHGNLVVVGDDDQSVYGWRGGSNEYLMRLAKENESVIMADNFRSNQQIADVGNRIIAKNKNRIPKEIRCARQVNNKPVILPHPDDENVLGILAGMCRRYGGENVAVIARDNPTLNKFGALMSKKGINHAECKDFLIDSKVFALIRDVLRLHHEGPVLGSESFTRLFVSEGGLGFVPVNAQYDEPYADALIRTGVILDIRDTVQNAKAWLNSELPTGLFGRKLMQSYKAINYGEGASKVVEDIFNIWFAGTTNELIVLDNILDKFEEGSISSVDQALSFMDTLVEYEDTSRVDYYYGKGFCRLLTAHDSKGKEFDAVLVLNADNFLKGGGEEDIRVLYVAATRARHTLVCTTLGEECEAELFSILGDSVQELKEDKDKKKESV